MRKLQAECQIQAMHVTEAKLCHHIVFQMSFRNIQRQKSYCNFWGDWSELWPSISDVDVYYSILKFAKECVQELT